ncbi:hypothetical protein Tco_0120816 [Tanacetum coccineum]
MSSLAEFVILNGVDNRPPMLDKLMYDSWKSRMELYMENLENGYLILESIRNGPLVWPMIEENGEMRRKRVPELSAPEKLQYEADVKATNIILQGVPTDVYALYNHIFVQLINDMHIYQMRLQQFQVNTKFLNSLPPEWSKFVTEVKLVKDLHVTNFDQLFAHLEHHEAHANEIHLLKERSHYSVSYPSTPQAVTYQSNTPQTIYQQPQAISQIDYQPQQTEFPALDSGLAVPVFNKGDDSIDAINKMMSFLSTMVTSRFPSTNNQLRNSSNPRQQATIQDGRVTVQQLEGHMAKQCPKPKRKRDASWFREKVLLVEAQANGQILHGEELAFLADLAKIALMVNLSHYGLDALAEVNNHDNVDNNLMNQVVQAMPSFEQSSVVNNLETEITSDSNIIPYSQYVIESQQETVQNSNSFAQQDALILYVIEQLKTQVVNCTKINLGNKSVNDTLTAKLERYKELSVEIDRLKQTLLEHLKEKESLMQTVTFLKNEFKKEESRNIDREIALEKKIKQLDNIVFKRDQSAQTVHMLTKPQFFYDHTTKQDLGFQNPFYLKKAQQLEQKHYDGNVIKNTSAIVILDSEKTLMLAEESYFETRFVPQTELSAEQAFWSHNFVNSSDRTPSNRPAEVEVSKELPKVSMVNTSLKKLKHHLAGFDVVVKERTTATAITEGSWGFKHTKACFKDEIIPFVKALKDLFNTFDQYLIDELSEVQNVFHQMEQAVEQHRLESKTFEVKMNQVLNENERLLEQVINKDIMNIIVNSSVNVHECEKCLKHETKLLNEKDSVEKEIYDKLFRSFTTLEKHCISLESQEKDTVIKKLKERITSLSENMKEDKIKKDIEEIETINIELDHRVSNLIDENEHLKPTYKQLYDSIKPAQIQEQGLTVTTLKDELRKLKGKGLADNVVSKHTIDPEMLNIDVEYLNPRLLNNRSTHFDYLKHTQEEVAILREIVKQGKSQNHLNESLDSALKPSNSASGSQPSGNTKKDKIQQTPSSTPKNKVEAHPRTVKSSLRNKNCFVEPKGNANVQHSKLNANLMFVQKPLLI